VANKTRKRASFSP